MAILLACSANSEEASHLVRIQAPQAEVDASHTYFVGLIKLALSKVTAPQNRKTVKFSLNMPQARALKELELGHRIDVYWAGTSIEREERLRAIRIPLLKGLLGYRVALVHKDIHLALSSVETAKALLQYRPCQGELWPDTSILEAGGFTVLKSPRYEPMFKQVNLRRCDFFPRGVHEAGAEYKAAKKIYPNIRLNKDVIIHYPFPMYFFVNKSNRQLAELIRKGLEKAIDDGSFAQHMHTSEVTKGLFPVESWINVRFLELPNPLLPADTDTKNPRYWIQHKEHNITFLK